MHEELFHSPDRPFRATPDSRFYFPHESIETARQTIVRAVMRAEGPVMVLGGAGLGKSLLGMVVSEDLDARFDVVKLHAARLCSRRALLQSILFELQLPYRDLSEGDLRLSILDRLEPDSSHAPEGILMVVDEAHTLPAKLLDELRLITNFTRVNQPRVRLVLIGSLRLEHTFAEPQLESFNQRLAARCYLQPMNRQQTREYVQHQFSVASVDPRQMITDEALGTVYAASEGVPRLANQIMDHALVLAITRNQCPLSSALIEEAWADLQQLPAPWHAGADRLNAAAGSRNSTGNAVEFGSLEDDYELDEPVDTRSTASSVSQKETASDTAAELAFADDSAADLRLADEPTDLFLQKPANSFFAAFVPPAEELNDDAEQLSDDAHALSPADEQNGAELLTRPRVVFDTRQAREQASLLEIEVDNEGLRFVPTPDVDSFFADRPTDERLLALEEEQREFDSMGVWENDPPLALAAADALSSFAVINKPRSPDKNLFGDDFEEEVCLSTSNTRQLSQYTLVDNSPRTAATQPSDRASTDEEETAEFVDSTTARTSQQAVAAADYVARIQQFADSVASGHDPDSDDRPCTVDEVLEHNQQANYPPVSYQSAFDTWSVDVASLDARHEAAVHDEIEDLVSQLNFAAFSVEPFSIEHIEIAPRDQRPQPPIDSVRGGKNDEIYTMHRPQEISEESVFNGWSADSQAKYDDDRDLLVVEEELPLTAKSANESEQPITKIAPYSQLFAKLRK